MISFMVYVARPDHADISHEPPPSEDWAGRLF